MSYLKNKAVLAASLAALALTACAASATADSTSTCPTRTAWAGSETPPQSRTATLVTIPVDQSITITHVTVSDSFAAHSAVYGEQLLLVGTSDGPLQVLPPQLPVTTADPAFGPLHVDSPIRHNENPTLNNGVIAARILKSATGSASALIDQDVTVPVASGGTVWVRYDSLSAVSIDPEVQIVLTYQPASC